MQGWNNPEELERKKRHEEAHEQQAHEEKRSALHAAQRAAPSTQQPASTGLQARGGFRHLRGWGEWVRDGWRRLGPWRRRSSGRTATDVPMAEALGVYPARNLWLHRRRALLRAQGALSGAACRAASWVLGGTGCCNRDAGFDACALQGDCFQDAIKHGTALCVQAW